MSHKNPAAILDPALLENFIERAQADINDGFDPFGQENFEEILRVPASVPNDGEFHG